MTLLYLVVVAAILAVYLARAVLSFRSAILIGLVFTSFSLPALPRFLINVSGANLLLQGVFVILACVFFLARRRKQDTVPFVCNAYTLGVLAVGLLLLVFILFSNAPAYGTVKTAYFVGQSVLPILAVAFLAPFTARDLRTIAITIIVGSMLGALTMLLFGDAGSGATDRAALGGSSNPISIARALGFGATLLLVYLLHTPMARAFWIPVQLAAVAVMGWAMITTGSRGPFTAVVLAAGLAVVMTRDRPFGRLTVLTNVVLVGASIAFVVHDTTWRQDQLGPGFTRISEAYETLGSNSSDSGRLLRYRIALEAYQASNGLGIGTGGFAYVLPPKNEREFPHNIFLEFAVELGLLGLAVLVAIIVYLTVQVFVRHDPSNALGKPMVALWLFTLFNACVSGDIASNSPFWISGFLLWVSLRVRTAPLTLPRVQRTRKELHEDRLHHHA